MENQQNSLQIDKWLKLVRAEGIGAVTFGRLLEQFGTVEDILAASVSQLTRVEGIGFKTAERIARTRNKFDTGAELALAARLGIWIINFQDSRYPPALRRIYDPPPVLYVKGTLQKSDNLSIAIVGSRRCSLYGSEQASRFGHFLASAGVTIVSGMARGIDSAAHRGAISASGRTIAVQGCGLANIFPPENNKLFEQICDNGACISELPLNYEPLAENFPPRNRIIAGLSLGTIVIEAMARSGSLITARAAMENDREVMAIPGKIDSPLSSGAHRLIKDGARLVDSIEDVMDALGCIGDGLREHVLESAQPAQKKIDTSLFEPGKLNLSSNEQAIFNSLNSEPIHIDHVITETGLGAGAINAGLISLRLKGLIKQLPGNAFAKK